MKLGRTLKKIGFTPANARKLLRGVASQFKPEQLKGELGELAQVALKSPVAKKIEKAIMGGKMCRLCINDFDVDEIDGEGFKSFLKGVARGAKKAGKAVGKVGKKVGRVAGAVTRAVAENPIIDTALSMVPGGEIIESGLEGLEKVARLTGGAMPMMLVPAETWSNMVGPLNAAFYPPQPTRGFGEVGSYMPPSEKKMKGGSFRVL